jgi:endo-1,4-beta-xylanase
VKCIEESNEMKGRKFSLAPWAATIALLLIGGMSAAYAAPSVAYSLATDADIQGKAAGSTFESSAWFIRSGSPALTIVDKNGIKGIKIVGRSQDWDCIDLRNLSSLPNGFDYAIKVTGHGIAGDKMKLSQPTGPWKTHVSQVAAADGSFALEASFTYAQLQAEKAVRIQSEATVGTFTIEGIVVTATPAAGGEAADPGAAGPAPVGAVLEDVAINFSAADKARWGGSFSVPNAANVSAEWVSNFGNGDAFSLKGAHLSASTDYTGANNAIRLSFDKPLAKNAVYSISYSVFVPAEGNKGKGALTGPGIVLNGDYAGATGVVKFPSAPGTIDVGTWKTVSVSTPAEGLNDTLKSIDFRYVVNEGPKHPDLWYIDNVSIKQKLLASSGPVEPDYMKYAALKDVYKDYFMVGTTSSGSRMSGDKLDIIKYHFNAFTPENEMKPASVQNVKGAFTYDGLDKQLEAVKGLSLIGHTLAWHSQTPSWMWGAPKALSAKEAKANMDAHVKSVLGRYGSSLYSIDVVNEAFADGANNADWRDNLRSNEGWYLAMGPEWVETAFLAAAAAVDAKKWDCKLYYNDYNLDYPDKAKSVYNMVKELNQKYAKKRPGGKPLIEGIGMQGHYNENTAPANVESSIKLFSSLPGVSVSVTELDVTYANSGSLTERQSRNQAIKYAQLFDIFKRNAAGPANGKKGRVERVTFWGTNDADSWRGPSFPLLFDKNLRAKEALKAVIDPGKYLAMVVAPAGKTYEAYPALKDVYKDYFTLGVFGSGEMNALVYNYAAFAPGNEMKPDSTQSQKGTFTYDAADKKFADLSARNPNMLFYGHTLAWHSQSPTWMWDAPPARFGQPGTLSKAVALANLRDHIDNVLGYYGGRLQGIDVVNEAIGAVKPGDWKASLAKGEGWYSALEWRWVELAFARAAKIVDSHPEWKCKLIYNDFGLDNPDKARVVYEMVKEINATYANLRPNKKPLIEVIGMQEHDSLATKASDVEASIKLFATLPGVKVNITEMDIGCPAGAALSPESENNQAMKYAEMFQVFRKYAAGPANKTGNPKVIDRVSICGVRDATTGWRAGEYALLFNSEGLAKQALVAVLDPEEFLATHKYIEKAAGPAPKPIDGVWVWDSGRGDSWSGANIILGGDASAWPWSTAGEGGKTAFVPEKDATYRLSLNYTANGTTAIRVRWVKDNTNGGYTKADGAVVNSYQYPADKVATTIPAYFNSGMVNAGSYTLTTEIKLDGSQAADGLIGNIAIRGGGGGNAYTINWIKVEKVGSGGAADKLLVSWPKQ